MIVVIFLFFLSLFVSGDDDSEIVYQIQKYRIERDRLFKHSDNSPLPEKDKKAFHGLSYFPIDLKYRFEVRLQEYQEKNIINIITSAGTRRKAVKYGYFEFDMHDQKCRLQVYKLLDIQKKYPHLLFVPFMDSTTGEESYAGGRYVDLIENDSGTYILDFNMAYNPSCAYGKEGYVCPIPPTENKLDVPIRAGEKRYAKEGH